MADRFDVVFRADASLQIGAGHVMRCLTLAQALAERGARCRFLCRDHPGHLAQRVRAAGFDIDLLPARPVDPAARGYGAWLGATPGQDAADCRAVLGPSLADWLVVDHYALAAEWERAMAASCRHLLAIDDLADRPHAAGWLLDQNLGRQPADYAAWVPPGCEVRAGPMHALLRPAFAAARPASLARRAPVQEPLAWLLSFGGVDAGNATTDVLQAMSRCALPAGSSVRVVMGGTSPHLDAVRRQALAMPWPTVVRVDVDDMAQEMARADVACGAAGGSAWERACLGLPTLMLVLAENQRPGAEALQAAGAALLLGDALVSQTGEVPGAGAGEATALQRALTHAMARISRPGALAALSAAAAALTDGQGAARLARRMEEVTHGG